ncbi:hypothetical protein ACOME3_004031 [Neoechinorhynchus agilis]
MSSELNPYAEEYIPGMYGDSDEDEEKVERAWEKTADDLNNLKIKDDLNEEEEKDAKAPKVALLKRDFSDKKEPVNVVFIGHVDAGKSTIGGQLMFLTGMIDKRTLEKYEKEAKEKNRESWYLSWALDVHGSTGIGHFDGSKILEAEKVDQNMICGLVLTCDLTFWRLILCAFSWFRSVGCVPKENNQPCKGCSLQHSEKK